MKGTQQKDPLCSGRILLVLEMLGFGAPPSLRLTLVCPGTGLSLLAWVWVSCKCCQLSFSPRGRVYSRTRLTSSSRRWCVALRGLGFISDRGFVGHWRVSHRRTAGGEVCRGYHECHSLAYRSRLRGNRGYHFPAIVLMPLLPIWLHTHTCSPSLAPFFSSQMTRSLQVNYTCKGPQYFFKPWWWTSFSPLPAFLTHCPAQLPVRAGRRREGWLTRENR